MKWNEVQNLYPNEWVVIEAIQAHSDEGLRLVDEMAIVQKFDDSFEAMKQCNELQRERPANEFYFFHTSRPRVEIRERRCYAISGYLQNQLIQPAPLEELVALRSFSSKL
ncbi:hypothetical protein [Cohnella abietis]|nr:hypothetical protein [Cohnella abietis]